MTALKNSDSTRKFADEVEFLLGSKNRTRYLKRTEKYGTLALLSAGWQPPDKDRAGQFVDLENTRWDADKFGKSCAGCHATAVDAKSHTFSAVSLDCFTCHGDVPLEHSKDATQAILSPHRQDSPRVIASVCGQCHIRGGESRSTKLSYANQFVAGDNLFRDLKVDWSDEHLATLNPADRHVMENLRDVVVYGKEEMTCLSCHNVHAHSSDKHQVLTESAICGNCHVAGNLTQMKKYDVHSRTCEY